MTTFTRIHTFLPFTLGRAVFQFDKTFQRVTRRWNVETTKKYFPPRKKEKGTKISMLLCAIVECAFSRCFWIIRENSTTPLRQSRQRLCTLWNEESWGEKDWAVKKMTAGHETWFCNIGWNNILRFWERKKGGEEGELLQRSCPAFNGVVTRWKLFSRIKSLVELTSPLVFFFLISSFSSFYFSFFFLYVFSYRG